MKKELFMHKWITAIVGLLIMAGSVVCFMFFMKLYEQDLTMMETYKPKTMIYSGELITEEKLVKVSIPVLQHTKTALTEAEAIIGKRAVIPIGESEEFMSWKLGEDDVFPQAGEGYYGFEITSVQAVNNMVRRGDRVNIWVEFSDPLDPKHKQAAESGQEAESNLSDSHISTDSSSSASRDSHISTESSLPASPDSHISTDSSPSASPDSHISTDSSSSPSASPDSLTSVNSPASPNASAQSSLLPPSSASTYTRLLLEDVRVAYIKDGEGKEITDPKLTSLGKLKSLSKDERDEYHFDAFRSAASAPPAFITFIMTPQQYDRFVEGRMEGTIRLGMDNPFMTIEEHMDKLKAKIGDESKP
jgi:hypothetical protein